MIGQGNTVSAAEWDARFMRLALEASHWSKDPDEQVGACLVSQDRRSITLGYNGLPWGMPDDPEILCNKDLKNILSIHAELNAMANCVHNIVGWTMYVTKAPCVHCALMTRQHRIGRVVSAPVREDSRWAQQQKQAMTLLQNLGVEVSWLQL